MTYFLCSLFVVRCSWGTESVLLVGGGSRHFQLIVHVVGTRDADRDLGNDAPLFFTADRTAQGDPAVARDDLHVFGVHREVFSGDDFLANPGRGLDIGLAGALIEGSQRAVFAVANVLRRVIRILGDIG